MPADTDIEETGVVVDVHPGSKFRVKLNIPGSPVIYAHLSGKMRTNSIKIVLGDRVRIAMSPYDLSKGRIIRRE